MSRKSVVITGLVVLALGGFAAGLGGWMVFGPNTPDYEGTRTVTLPTATTDSLDAVIDALASEGILASPTSFRLVAQATGWDAQVKPGHYAFESGTSTYRLLDVLRRGLQTPVRLTIPPGSRPQVVAAVAASRLRLSEDAFLSALRDTSLARSLGVEPGHLFGYLMPETYEFYWQAPPERVLQRIQRAFDRFYERELAAAADSLDLSKHDAVTLASIVEWEALLDDEKPAIAGVYLNRLDRGWKLEADPTIQYVLIDSLGERVRRVLYKHLEIDHPYNTYRIRGLPPGPITNPAPSTLRAVVQPARHDYMYFAADGTGGHTFSRTLREHNRAAQKYHELLDERRRERQQRSEDSN
jgi:UPF0755 protein